jgi:hypothetical protein
VAMSLQTARQTVTNCYKPLHVFMKTWHSIYSYDTHNTDRRHKGPETKPQARYSQLVSIFTAALQIPHTTIPVVSCFGPRYSVSLCNLALF